MRAELTRFRSTREHGDPFVTTRRLVRRMIAGGVVCVLMSAVFLGVNYGPAFLLEQRPFVRYWTACLAMVVLLLLLAFLDLRETRRVATREMRLELERALRLVDGGTDDPKPPERDPSR